MTSEQTKRFKYWQMRTIIATMVGYALFYFVRNRNIALYREKILNEVWGYDFFGDNRTLDTHIKLLRKSLGPYSKFIVTLRGVGYRFEV